LPTPPAAFDENYTGTPYCDSINSSCPVGSLGEQPECSTNRNAPPGSAPPKINYYNIATGCYKKTSSGAFTCVCCQNDYAKSPFCDNGEPYMLPDGVYDTPTDTPAATPAAPTSAPTPQPGPLPDPNAPVYDPNAPAEPFDNPDGGCANAPFTAEGKCVSCSCANTNGPNTDCECLAYEPIEIVDKCNLPPLTAEGLPLEPPCLSWYCSQNYETLEDGTVRLIIAAGECVYYAPADNVATPSPGEDTPAPTEFVDLPPSELPSLDEFPVSAKSIGSVDATDGTYRRDFTVLIDLDASIGRRRLGGKRALAQTSAGGRTLLALLDPRKPAELPLLEITVDRRQCSWDWSVIEQPTHRFFLGAMDVTDAVAAGDPLARFDTVEATVSILFDPFDFLSSVRRPTFSAGCAGVKISVRSNDAVAAFLPAPQVYAPPVDLAFIPVVFDEASVAYPVDAQQPDVGTKTTSPAVENLADGSATEAQEWSVTAPPGVFDSSDQAILSDPNTAWPLPTGFEPLVVSVYLGQNVNLEPGASPGSKILTIVQGIVSCAEGWTVTEEVQDGVYPEFWRQGLNVSESIWAGGDVAAAIAFDEMRVQLVYTYTGDPTSSLRSTVGCAVELDINETAADALVTPDVSIFGPPVVVALDAEGPLSPVISTAATGYNDGDIVTVYFSTSEPAFEWNWFAIQDALLLAAPNALIDRIFPEDALMEGGTLFIMDIDVGLAADATITLSVPAGTFVDQLGIPNPASEVKVLRKISAEAQAAQVATQAAVAGATTAAAGSSIAASAAAQGAATAVTGAGSGGAAAMGGTVASVGPAQMGNVVTGHMTVMLGHVQFSQIVSTQDPETMPPDFQALGDSLSWTNMDYSPGFLPWNSGSTTDVASATARRRMRAMRRPGQSRHELVPVFGEPLPHVGGGRKIRGLDHHAHVGGYAPSWMPRGSATAGRPSPFHHEHRRSRRLASGFDLDEAIGAGTALADSVDELSDGEVTRDTFYNKVFVATMVVVSSALFRWLAAAIWTRWIITLKTCLTPWKWERRCMSEEELEDAFPALLLFPKLELMSFVSTLNTVTNAAAGLMIVADANGSYTLNVAVGITVLVIWNVPFIAFVTYFVIIKWIIIEHHAVFAIEEDEMGVGKDETSTVVIPGEWVDGAPGKFRFIDRYGHLFGAMTGYSHAEAKYVQKLREREAARRAKRTANQTRLRGAAALLKVKGRQVALSPVEKEDDTDVEAGASGGGVKGNQVMPSGDADDEFGVAQGGRKRKVKKNAIQLGAEHEQIRVTAGAGPVRRFLILLLTPFNVVPYEARLLYWTLAMIKQLGVAVAAGCAAKWPRGATGVMVGLEVLHLSYTIIWLPFTCFAELLCEIFTAFFESGTAAVLFSLAMVPSLADESWTDKLLVLLTICAVATQMIFQVYMVFIIRILARLAREKREAELDGPPKETKEPAPPVVKKAPTVKKDKTIKAKSIKAKSVTAKSEPEIEPSASRPRSSSGNKPKRSLRMVLFGVKLAKQKSKPKPRRRKLTSKEKADVDEDIARVRKATKIKLGTLGMLEKWQEPEGGWGGKNNLQSKTKQKLEEAKRRRAEAEAAAAQEREAKLNRRRERGASQTAPEEKSIWGSLFGSS